MPITIDPQFVDVDFTRDPNYTFGDLGHRAFSSTMTEFEQVFGVIPSAKWPELIEKIDASAGWIERLITRIYNQGREGSCVSNATGQAHEIIQAAQYGKPNVIHLSAISLYKRVARSASSGSMLDANLDEIERRGILPLDTPENRARFTHVMPATGFTTPFPAGWETTAGLLTSIERYIIRTFEGIITALLQGFPVVVGRQGHSICYVRPVYRNGALAVIYANSWGPWGFGAGDFTKGFGLDSTSQIRQSASWAFALRSVNVKQSTVVPAAPDWNIAT